MMAMNFHHNGVFALMALSTISMYAVMHIDKVADYRMTATFCAVLSLGIDVLRRMAREDSEITHMMNVTYRLWFLFLLQREGFQLVAATFIATDFIMNLDEFTDYAFGTTMTRLATFMSLVVAALVFTTKASSMYGDGIMALFLSMTHPWFITTITGDLRRQMEKIHGHAPPTKSSERRM